MPSRQINVNVVLTADNMLATLDDLIDALLKGEATLVRVIDGTGDVPRTLEFAVPDPIATKKSASILDL